MTIQERKDRSLRIQDITNRTVIAVSLPLVVASAVGIWKLSESWSTMNHRLERIEEGLNLSHQSHWTLGMERDAWREYDGMNVPDVDEIHQRYRNAQ